ncbi:MAG TPA: hypothetical protein VKE70_10460 [Candidatus Solibacter sp.]|nr:hypothetical protein [Candidatus Solibacter sp.]
MESTLLGIVLDSSVLIAAERRNLTPDQAIATVRAVTGDIPVVLSSLTIAEIGHGIYRANTPEIRARRRAFLNELKATLPIRSQRQLRKSSPESAVSKRLVASRFR